jgi:hypothetical protein
MPRYITSHQGVDVADEQLAVVFLQRRPKKGWFAVTEVCMLHSWSPLQVADNQEMVPYEEHLIRLRCSQAVKKDSNTALLDALMKILTFCNTNKANVPPLVGSGEESNLSHQVYSLKSFV